MLEQINELRKRNEHLQAALDAVPKAPPAPTIDLAPLTDEFKLTGTYSWQYGGSKTHWTVSWSWERIFYVIAPDLLEWTNDDTVNRTLARGAVKAATGTAYSYSEVDDECFKTVRIQMVALGLVDVQPKTTVAKTSALFWAITPQGRQALMRIRTVKPSGSPATLIEG